MSAKSESALRAGKVTKLSLAERAQARAVGRIDGLPKVVKLGLSGQRPIKIDGNKLDPTIQAMLAAQKRMGQPGLTEGPVSQSRRLMKSGSAIAGGKPEAVADVREVTIPGPAGPIKARHYLPIGATTSRPMMVFFHGGGWVLGDLDTHDVPARFFCAKANIHVLSVDYRLAPEHKAPHAANDCFAAYKWAVENAESLGVDPDRIAVGGDSAGGNLSAVVSLKAKQEGFQLPSLQFLIYPVTDLVNSYPSHSLFADGFLLTTADIAFFKENYLRAADGSEAADPMISPMLATDLAGLPPALITTAGFDPLRDEGNAYAAALEAAGVKVELKQYDSLTHGFINMVGIGGEARRATEELALMLRLLIDR